MRLSDKQKQFSYDVARLIVYINERRYAVTMGEAQRTTDQQKIYVKTGRSKTHNSQHLKKLAIDLFFFNFTGKLVWDRKELQQFGNYWESLRPENKWGGNWKSFKDVPHFERQG